MSNYGPATAGSPTVMSEVHTFGYRWIGKYQYHWWCSRHPGHVEAQTVRSPEVAEAALRAHLSICIREVA
jgi:hypothetical protein